MKILILTNNSVGLYKFRKELLQELIGRNHKVYVDMPDEEFLAEIKDIGCKAHINKFLDRRGTSPAKDLSLLRFYYAFIRKIEPNVVITFTIKPNIYGGLACQRLHIPYISVITGLGTAIQNPSILRTITLNLYKAGVRKAASVFFENNSNEQFFKKQKIAVGRHIVVSGAGVNTEEFFYAPYPHYNKNHDRFLFVGRIMKDKGIEEFVEAAKKIKINYPEVHFDICGGYDEDRYRVLVEAAVREGIVEYHGQVNDVKPYYKSCSVLVLPTYHEGMANTLQEAASMGRPVIASRIPGCSEIFEEDKTGFGIIPRNAGNLEMTIKEFISLPDEKKAEMGKNGRKKMIQEFERKTVIDRYISEIEKAV